MIYSGAVIGGVLLCEAAWRCKSVCTQYIFGATAKLEYNINTPRLESRPNLLYIGHQFDAERIIGVRKAASKRSSGWCCVVLSWIYSIRVSHLLITRHAFTGFRPFTSASHILLPFPTLHRLIWFNCSTFGLDSTVSLVVSCSDVVEDSDGRRSDQS